MQCMIPNTCADRALCCNFCGNMQCPVRCKDDHEKCKYFEREQYERLQVKKDEPKKRIWSNFWRKKV